MNFGKSIIFKKIDKHEFSWSLITNLPSNIQNTWCLKWIIFINYMIRIIKFFLFFAISKFFRSYLRSANS